MAPLQRIAARPAGRWVKQGFLLWCGFIFLDILTPLGAKTNKPGVIYWHGPSEARCIALTFDDGPNEPYTSDVLRVLREQQVRATFFMMGKNVEAFPETARNIVREGHAIGNHTYTHRSLLLNSNASVRREIRRTEEVIERTTGQKTRLFRPPYGDKDFLTVRQTRKLGYVMVEWSVTSGDWRMPGADRIVRNVLKHAHPGAIVLLHDGDRWRHGGDRSQTVAALPTLIRELRRQGYAFVTIPELLGLPEGG
jgi:peptidoglycan-N-acetylglucosamine deacetylase